MAVKKKAKSSNGRRKQSLMDRALSVPTRGRKANPRTDEEIDLARAWAIGRVSTKQVMEATERQTGSVYAFLAQALAESHRRHANS